MAEYCLRWNNHQPNLVTVFSELLTAESLVDVTLAADGHFIHAHRLVLSACSVYFKDLFNGTNSWKHPIVFLKDIRIEDLKTVIDFIYRGEVNVSQERLQDVIKTAESLRIKGLTDKPFNYEDYPSQARGQQLSSSFSSQRSSLTDSREQLHSVEAEDTAEGSGSSPPHTKKRKLTSQDSSESTQDSSQEADEKQRSTDPKEDSRTAPIMINEERAKTPSISIKEKIKEENSDSPSAAEPHPEYQESRAADAMLLLQGSSSEGGGDEGGTPSSLSGTPISTSRDTGTGLISSHPPGNLDWSLSLSHWWASVLPALAQHHHHTGPSQPSLHHPSSPYLSRSLRHQASSTSLTRSPDVTISHTRGVGNGSSSTSREGSPSGGGPMVVGSLDQLSLVSALGKEISPQMVQALQAVAARRESFSSAAKLYSVSVTTLWRYFRKLGLSDRSVMCQWGRSGFGPPPSTLEALLDCPLSSSSSHTSASLTSTSPPVFMMGGGGGGGSSTSSVMHRSTSHSHHFFFAAAAAAAAAAGGFSHSAPYLAMPPAAFFMPYAEWHSQFRRMSPNMLLAIDAVRSGRMGFTQAGKTYGVNGRTLWVYYRKLGYEVHNTFRGKKSRPSSVLAPEVVSSEQNPPSKACITIPNSLGSCTSDLSPPSCAVHSDTPFHNQRTPRPNVMQDNFEVLMGNMDVSVPHSNSSADMILTPFDDVKNFNELNRHLIQSQHPLIPSNQSINHSTKPLGTSAQQSVSDLDFQSPVILNVTPGIHVESSGARVENSSLSGVNMLHQNNEFTNQGFAMPNLNVHMTAPPLSSCGTSYHSGSLVHSSSLKSPGHCADSTTQNGTQTYCRYNNNNNVIQTFPAQSNISNNLCPVPSEPQPHGSRNSANSYVETAAKTVPVHAGFLNSNVEAVAHHITPEDGNTIESILESCNFRNLWGNV